MASIAVHGLRICCQSWRTAPVARAVCLSLLYRAVWQRAVAAVMRNGQLSIRTASLRMTWLLQMAGFRVGVVLLERPIVRLASLAL